MGKVITYKNGAGGVFAQIKLDSGEKILISISTSLKELNFKIHKLLWGYIPIGTIYKSGINEAINIFLEKEDWGKEGILLDKSIEKLIDCKSIQGLKEKIQELNSKQP